MILFGNSSFISSKDSASAHPSQHEQENSEGNKRGQTKKKKKEFDLPITSRISGPNKSELDRLIAQEVS